VKTKIYIGTSGWHYKHWIGTFYPHGTRDFEQLAYYLRFFKSVELNNSFYRLPPPQIFSNWKKAVPSDFVFAVKGSRFISHMKKLNVERESVSIFFKSVTKLKEKLGPILFQLPPKWKLNVERLSNFLRILPKKHRYAFEFRNQTWYNEKVYALLKKYSCSFCIYELEHHLSPVITTADFVYVRLHGPGSKYAGSYTAKQLSKWANYCREWQRLGKDVYIYFDNDQLGYAAFNAQTLQKLVSKFSIKRNTITRRKKQYVNKIIPSSKAKNQL
jgi:uncharacterized protein YecE (DUF72 family)